MDFNYNDLMGAMGISTGPSAADIITLIGVILGVLAAVAVCLLVIPKKTANLPEGVRPIFGLLNGEPNFAEALLKIIFTYRFIYAFFSALGGIFSAGGNIANAIVALLLNPASVALEFSVAILFIRALKAILAKNKE